MNFFLKVLWFFILCFNLLLIFWLIGYYKILQYKEISTQKYSVDIKKPCITLAMNIIDRNHLCYYVSIIFSCYYYEQ